MTAIYMMTIVVRGFFPEKGFDEKALAGVKDPSWQMVLPLLLFSLAIIGFGLYSTPAYGFPGEGCDGRVLEWITGRLL